MKKIGFIGVYDKTDLILYVAKILAITGKKILMLDATTTQKCKYVVPVINPTRTYITRFEDIDVGVGFESLERVRQYLCLDEDEELDYDLIIVDTDNYEGLRNFNIYDSEKIYFATSFDAYSLKRGIEILSGLERPIRMTKIFYTKEISTEEEDYFNYLALETKVEWNEEKIYVFLENGDSTILIENQRLSTMKMKKLSNEFKSNISHIVNDIDNEIDEKKVKGIIKSL